ncbi:non-ribosomal peptide synthetase [Amycolatopsis nigrescens]|uniref:non-ribosomal peptide synthetase n=1 Tax=Amycolatopsis nigrescens TaxID=381445 RepID=UPI0003A9DF61|nr:non-ribosomal peptide synthetase [Amycolatopsis nigrescens]
MVHTSIPECFAAQVARTPDAVAVSSGALQLTYRELDERAGRLAQRLRDLGTLPEEPVAIDMDRSAVLVVAILAVLKAGASYLPLHSAYPIERSQRIVDGAGCRVLLADEVTRRRGLPRGCTVVLADDELEYASRPEPGVTAPAGPNRIAYLMHTSGSTGQPKGVAVTHRGVLGLALDSCWDGGRHERVLMVAPYAFGVSTYELWVPLLRGGRIVIPAPGPLDVRGLRREITEGQITGLHLTAGLFRVIADEAPDCLDGVREVLTGGDVIAPKAVQRVLEACPDLVVRAMYGGTEVSSFATSSPMTAPYRASTSVPVGRALDDVELHILDAALRPVGRGEVGELYIGGERLALGYAGRAGLTAERFVADPFAGGGRRLYRTGDLMRWTPDGLLEFVGRASDQVKIRGFRVELGEVEAVLAGHAGVAHVAVVAKAPEPGEQRLVAYVVPGHGEFDTTALLAHAAASLPEYMLPSTVVVLTELPLTSNGKLDRAALPEPVFATAGGYRAPETPRQEALCALFTEVLGVARVGVDDSFFDLDGQSLLAMRLVSRIGALLDVELSIADVFNAPTVSDLDKLIEDMAPADESLVDSATKGRNG